MNRRNSLWILVVLCALGLTSPRSASSATIAYWNHQTGTSTLPDLVGGDQTLVGGGNVVSSSALNIAPLPVPNPDAVTTGGAGSIYFSSEPNVNVPHLSSASVFQMTGSSSFTFEGWIQANQGATGYIASDRHQGNSYRGWFLELKASGAIQFYSNSGGTANSIASSAVTDGTGHHFAAVWDHTASQMSLYVDGVIQGTPQSHSVGAYSVYGFAIGGRDGTSGGGAFVDNRLTAGTRLDEMRFSNAALSPSEFLNVPEPATLALLGLGGLLMPRRRSARAARRHG